jgi:hypothetical protein
MIFWIFWIFSSELTASDLTQNIARKPINPKHPKHIDLNQ